MLERYTTSLCTASSSAMCRQRGYSSSSKQLFKQDSMCAGANQSELKASPTSSYSSDETSSVDSSDSEEKEVGPTQVVLDLEAVTAPGPSAISSSDDESSVDSESSAELEGDVSKTQEVVAGSCMQAFSSFTLDGLVDRLSSQSDPFS